MGYGMGSTLKRYRNLGNIDILITLIIPIHERGRENNWVMSSATCFSKGGQLAAKRLAMEAVSCTTK